MVCDLPIAWKGAKSMHTLLFFFFGGGDIFRNIYFIIKLINRVKKCKDIRISSILKL